MVPKVGPTNSSVWPTTANNIAFRDDNDLYEYMCLCECEHTSVYGSLVQPDALCAHTFHKDSVSDFTLLLIIATW